MPFKAKQSEARAQLETLKEEDAQSEGLPDDVELLDDSAVQSLWRVKVVGNSGTSILLADVHTHIYACMLCVYVCM